MVNIKKGVWGGGGGGERRIGEDYGHIKSKSFFLKKEKSEKH